jgi:hypothetical protein
VLFGDAEVLQTTLVGAVAAAPEGAGPLDAVAAGLEAAGAVLEERRDVARQRQSIVAANAELRERELIKLAALAASVAETLRGRGVEEPAASLAAEAGIAAFRIAFERWVEDPQRRDLPGLIRGSLDELSAVAAASRRSPPDATAARRGGRAARR